MLLKNGDVHYRNEIIENYDSFDALFTDCQKILRCAQNDSFLYSASLAGDS